jgi:serine/threonine-protein kinase
MIGTIVGNYQLTEKLGEGGMGAVYKGIDLMLEREVAVKALRPELLSRPDLVERFRSEAVTLAKLNHPNIATLYSFFRQADEFFMVLEFVPGETLEALVRRCGALPDAHAAFLIGQALDGIAHAHQAGVVHRDLKLANLMLAPNQVVKVTDFGIARALGHDRLTRAGRLVGTIEYMSPEQIRGQDVDARSDFYALGAVLYEMVTGRLPFQSDSEYELMRAQIEDAPPPPRDLAPQVSSAMEQVILRALAKQPEDRFQSAAEFRAALDEIIAAAPVNGTITRKTPVPETRLNFCAVISGEVANPRPQAARPRFTWKHAAAVVAIATASVLGSVALTKRHQTPPTMQVVAAPLATPSATLTATPLATPTPEPSPEPLPTPTVMPSPLSTVAPVAPAPKPTAQAKAKPKQVEDANAAARRAAERNRRLADAILNK